MNDLTPNDFFAIAATTVIIVLGVILWSLRSHLIPVVGVLYHLGRQAFFHFFEVRYPAPTPAPAPTLPSAPARTGADDGMGDLEHTEAIAPDEGGACVRAEGAISAGSLVLAPEEIAAVSRMIVHNKTLTKPNKLATIQAADPTIKNRSGDRTSKYARWSDIYDALFNAPAETQYPTLMEQRAKTRRTA